MILPCVSYEGREIDCWHITQLLGEGEVSSRRIPDLTFLLLRKSSLSFRAVDCIERSQSARHFPAVSGHCGRLAPRIRAATVSRLRGRHCELTGICANHAASATTSWRHL